MSTFRHWIYENVAVRLDGRHERKILAWTLAALFLAVAVIPGLLRAQSTGTSDTRETTGTLSEPTVDRSASIDSTSTTASTKETDATSTAKVPNVAPTVSWAEPGADQTFPEGAVVRLRALATDPPEGSALVFEGRDGSGSAQFINAKALSEFEWIWDFVPPPSAYAFVATLSAPDARGVRVVVARSPERRFIVVKKEPPPEPVASATPTPIVTAPAPSEPVPTPAATSTPVSETQGIVPAAPEVQRTVAPDPVLAATPTPISAPRPAPSETPPSIRPAAEPTTAARDAIAAAELARTDAEVAEIFRSPESYVVPKVSVIPAPADPLKDECRAAGVLPSRCGEWLATRYQSKDCRAAGALTREACSRLLAASGQTVDEKALVGLPEAIALDAVRAEALRVGGIPTPVTELPIALRQILPIRDDRARVTIVSAAEAPSTKPDFVPAVGLVTVDTDGDGLPDDLERRLGTDPSDPDSDADGFSDGDEARNGYDPLGPGRLEKALAGIDAAIVSGAPLEEPRAASDRTDAGLSLAVALPPSGTVASSLNLSGTADPNAVVAIYVYSFLPVVVTTTTDAEGRWTYDFSGKLADGRHEAYVSINDDAGAIAKTSSPFSFFVREASAASEDEFLRGDVNVVRPEAVAWRWYVIGGLALVLVSLILVMMVIREARRRPIEPPAALP